MVSVGGPSFWDQTVGCAVLSSPWTANVCLSLVWLDCTRFVGICSMEPPCNAPCARAGLHLLAVAGGPANPSCPRWTRLTGQHLHCVIGTCTCALGLLTRQESCMVQRRRGLYHTALSGIAHLLPWSRCCLGLGSLALHRVHMQAMVVQGLDPSAPPGQGKATRTGQSEHVCPYDKRLCCHP